MKQLSVPLANGSDLLLKEVPNDATDFIVGNYDVGISPEFCGLHYYTEIHGITEQLPPDNKYQFLGTVHTKDYAISFPVHEEWVEKFGYYEFEWYKDYCTDKLDGGTYSIEQSFKSLLKSGLEKAFDEVPERLAVLLLTKTINQ